MEIRFGTSGFRGRWGNEFTERRVKCAVQAICDDLIAQGLQNKSIVLGYDSREHADEVACWCAEVCVANQFLVHLTLRDTPTPVLAYYGLEVVLEENLAGIINCTASHNPIEWHGIKFSTRNGCPAPLEVTKRIEVLANRYQSESRKFPIIDLAQARRSGQLIEFDPLEKYCDWILSSGINNRRIKLDLTAINSFFSDKKIILDEMHGTGRGYLRRILDEIGVSYEVLHGERDPRLGGLPAANPEEPYIQQMQARVRESQAIHGIGLDTDADRYGVVNQDGNYITPNQVLAMLTKYLGVDRKLTGRIAVSHVTTRLVETIAGEIPNNDEFKPHPNAIPPYLNDPSYQVVVGKREDLSTRNVFTVPVGLKYIVEVPQMDSAYNILEKPPANWRELLLLGGEEASGLTTRRHVPDKDGIWAALLIIDMMAFYHQSLGDIWSDVSRKYWPSHTKRLNLDVPESAKARFISSFLDEFSGAKPGQKELAGLRVIYAGGIRDKLIEMRLEDSKGSRNYYLFSRPSGTEPLVRVYLEGESEERIQSLDQAVQARLEKICSQSS
ncbi:hypothetical protein HY229_03170 [Candidatus Acetothermia bacterium]|nr:hypothetical protein [Candidatus Acetothermia bacterium]MBI3643085.1 hypothetical protein [Candidatus Acetothermia bacterium]